MSLCVRCRRQHRRQGEAGVYVLLSYLHAGLSPACWHTRCRGLRTAVFQENSCQRVRLTTPKTTLFRVGCAINLLQLRRWWRSLVAIKISTFDNIALFCYGRCSPEGQPIWCPLLRRNMSIKSEQAAFGRPDACAITQASSIVQKLRSLLRIRNVCSMM